MSFGRVSYGLGQSVQSYLDLISQYESNNQNIPNYKFGPGVTAQGYYQITNTNWTNVAPKLGIDISLYPNAMSAPQDLQAQVATYLLTQTPGGISNWANYNPRLMTALTASGMQTSGPVTDSSVAAGTPGGPLFDISGAAAATPTATIMDQLQTASAGLDLTSSPVTGVLLAAGLGAAAYLFFR